tara:strand:- start:563 stop:1771 length:1209 start_codon:yes stop_codon:yes gene_type:complete
METTLKDLLENTALGDELKATLQEAFENKIRSMETRLHEDYAARYQNDKAVLVEAMDRMLNDTIRSELGEFAEDRAKFRTATKTASQRYKARLREHMKAINSFVARQLNEEMSEFVKDRRQLKVQRRQMATELESIRENTSLEYSQRVRKLEEFVLKQLSEEIAEFHSDKKALVEQRVKLAQQGRQRIEETRTQFINRAKNLVENTLNTVIRDELSQWRDDIKVARENNFGRKIFEAYAAEYMNSYLAEHSEVRKLNRELTETNSRLDTTLRQVDRQKQTQTRLVEDAQARIKTAEDRAQRMEIMQEITAPLGREKRAVMEDLLKGIRTQNLREAFNRYLPTVMQGNVAPASRGKQALAESQPQEKRAAVTGNRTNTLAESVSEETRADLGQILYLAGINRE